MIDKTDDLKNKETKEFLKKIPLNRCFLIFNKIDLFKFDKERKINKLNPKSLNLCDKPGKKQKRTQRDEETENQYKSFLLNQILETSDFDEKKIFFISALKGLHLDELRESMEHFMGAKNFDPKAGVVTQARHFTHLSKLQKNLCKTLELLKAKESPDLISQEMGMGLNEIHRILGKKYNDEVLDKIFSEFCIGK